MSSREVISAWAVFLFLFYLETCKQQSQETARWGRRERVQQRFGGRESRVQHCWRSVKPGFAGADGAELQMCFARLSLCCASESLGPVCPAPARAPGLGGRAAGATRGSVALGSAVGRQQRDLLPEGTRPALGTDGRRGRALVLCRDGVRAAVRSPRDGQRAARGVRCASFAHRGGVGGSVSQRALFSPPQGLDFWLNAAIWKSL